MDRESSTTLTVPREEEEELPPLQPAPAEACAEVDIREFFDDADDDASFFFLGSVADLTSGAALTLEAWVGVRERGGGTPRREDPGVARWEAALPLRAEGRGRGGAASGVEQALRGSLVGLRSEGMRQRVGGLVKSKNMLPAF